MRDSAFLSPPQSAKRKNALLVTHRLLLITLVFSFVLCDCHRKTLEFSALLRQLWENLIQIYMHARTHTCTHTQADIHPSVSLSDILIFDIPQYYAEICLFWHILYVLCQNVPLEFINVYVSRLVIYRHRTYCIILLINFVESEDS